VDEFLLHTCCGPCASGAVPAWRAEGLEPLAFFCNPNIQPAAEYARRVSSAHDMAVALDVRLEVAELEVEWVQPWLAEACRSGSAPAAPVRCHDCIGARLTAAAARCAALGLPRFGTTLAISPYQPHDVIRGQGEAAAAAFAVEFVYADQRRYYRRSREEARRLGLYRQKYCGCVPSKWEAWSAPERRRGRG
jgi:predicted adenine nucleotide alpha hydrolase (AANH) superfamily ATPase